MYPSRDHAVVVGGGIAGLLAAHSLSEHFERITIIERDHCSGRLQARKGVPQASHLHVLLTRGARIVESMFPGIGAELNAAGAVNITVGRDLGWLSPFGWLPPFTSTLALRGCTRGLLESVVRERVHSCKRIELWDGYEATDIAVESGRVRGLRVSPVRGDGRSKSVSASVVVEAAGRGSRLAERLHGLGYHLARASIVDASVGYATCVFEGKASLPNGWKMVYALWSPERPRAAALLPVEEERFMVTCVGAQGNYPPGDLAGFKEYARSLRTPVVYDAIRNAKPASPIAVSRSTHNRRYHFEDLPLMPRGLFAVGDAVCAFNPIYGQGMTVAALEAEALRSWLSGRNGAKNREGDFAARVAAALAPAWTLATGEDFRFEGTVGERPLGLRLMHRYLDRVYRIAVRQPEMAAAMARVFMMVDSPIELMRPRIALNVLRDGLRKG